MTPQESKVTILRSASKTTKSTLLVYPETPRRSTRKEVPPSMAKTVTIWEKESSESPSLKSRKGRVAVWQASFRLTQEKMTAPSTPMSTTKCKPANRRILREVRGLAAGRLAHSPRSPALAFVAKGHRYNLRPRPLSTLVHPEKTESIKPMGWQKLFKDQLDAKRKIATSKVVDTRDPFA